MNVSYSDTSNENRMKIFHLKLCAKLEIEKYFIHLIILIRKLTLTGTCTYSILPKSSTISNRNNPNRIIFPKIRLFSFDKESGDLPHYLAQLWSGSNLSCKVGSATLLPKIWKCGENAHHAVEGRGGGGGYGDGRGGAPFHPLLLAAITVRPTVRLLVCRLHRTNQ